MSYITDQKTKIAEAQVVEALLRMKKLKLHENAIKEFRDRGKLNLSEGKWGTLFWLDDVEKRMVREWEAKTGNVVYHVIKNQMEFGLCYSFLYVSPDADEWPMNNEDLENGYAFAYVKNVTDPLCSEYGSIGIEPRFGGLVRTA